MIIRRGSCKKILCFRCWEVRSFGGWGKASTKTPKLQVSLSPSSESKKREREVIGKNMTYPKR